jgi:hypothetical protein
MTTLTTLTPASLAKKTMPELVAIFNDLAPKGETVKRFTSRDVGIERIRALAKSKRKASGAAAPRGLGVGKLARSLLAKKNGLTYEQIAEKVNAEIDGASATAKSIAWYAHSMRAAGETVADRPRANAAATVH